MLKRSFLCVVIISPLVFSSCFIAGRVSDANGVGVACITVTLNGDQTRTTTTNSKGIYYFGDWWKLDIIPVGSYTITPSNSEYGFIPASRNVTISTHTVENIENVPWPAVHVDFEIMTEVNGDVNRMCAANVALTWNSCINAVGYKIYYSVDSQPIGTGPPYEGTGAAEGASPVDVGNTTTSTLHFAVAGGVRFALTAYNQHGESRYSPEVAIP